MSKLLKSLEKANNWNERVWDYIDSKSTSFLEKVEDILPQTLFILFTVYIFLDKTGLMK